MTLSRACSRSTASVLSLLWITTVSLSACTRHDPPPPPDASAQLQTIAPADPSKFSALGENKHWGNPYVVIRPDAVALLTSTAANEEQILKPDEVLNALSRLPSAAWPYGRAVAILVEEKSTSSEQDKVALRRNRGIVAGDLESAHVAIRWIPSS